ncbi:SH3 domain-containing protein [Roseovarius sp. CAU 1744]|uniref:SH3 domain-containing protein n=1 Tax=Roseovarius sp. CAU 1744 TaxID=3140368 RepID=UPI00325AD17F
MWRFILITFAFLGWSFYVLSGGADYEPGLQSLQARAELNDLRPLARPAAEDVAQAPGVTEAADETTEVTRALSSLDDLELSKDGPADVTLAALQSDATSEPEFEADTQKVDTLTRSPDIATDTATIDEQASPAQDLRRVTGTVVNMRDGPSTFYLAIGKLRKGAQVEVLENSGDGWLKIRATDSGQEGWMADWLVSSAAN